MSERLTALAAVLAVSAAGTALAGRPLATDDAGTAAHGTCQVEAWHERLDSDRAWVVAPACGVAEGVELGGDLVRARLGGDELTAAGLAMKIVPAGWQWDSPAGPLAWGVKLGLGGSRGSGQDWHLDGYGALLLATWAPLEGVTVHGNLGPEHDRAASRRTTLLNLALTWAPAPQALVFAEVQAADRQAYGGPLRTLGARWWLAPDQLGIDLTASRENGARASTLWTVGFGWYGIGL